MAESAMPSKSTGNVAQLADQRIQSAESAMPRKSTGSVAQLAEQRTQSAESSTKAADRLMDFIRALGYVPPEHGEHNRFDSADSNKNMQSPVTHSSCRKRCDPPFMLVMAGVLPAYAAQSGQCSVYLRIFPVSCNTNLRIIRGI